MIEPELQYLTDADGSARAVVVPMESWRRLSSEMETFRLVHNSVMHGRIRTAMQRGTGISFDEGMRQIEYDAAGFEDLAWWNKYDHEKAVEIVQLIKELQRDPFEGSGHPTALLFDLEGCWSRRIDRHHRLVYQVVEDKIRILACRNHEEAD
ncbi:MAG: Txe/YoeB family addiction module toxin [Bacteroidota bacterium]